jgi:hypothetical protein
MSLAYHNLIQDQLRSTLSIVGVGLAIMLILILNGFLLGIDQTASTYLDHAPGSVVVARQDVKNFIASSSFLPPGTAEAVRNTAGVAEVAPILTQPVSFELHGQKQFVELIVYDPR